MDVVARGKGRRPEKERADGGVRSAGQAPHQPDTATALGLRLGDSRS